MYLETLLEEESSIKSKITSALTTMKQWFLDKIDQVKEAFTSLKNKIAEKLRSVKSGMKISKDILDEDGNKILSKGDSSDKAKGKIKTLLSGIKTKGDKTVADCRNGIKAVGKGSSELANKYKTTIISGLKGIAAGIVVSLAIVGAMKANESNVPAVIEEDVDFEALLESINNIEFVEEDVDFEALFEDAELEEDVDFEALFEDAEIENINLDEDVSLESLLEEIESI